MYGGSKSHEGKMNSPGIPTDFPSIHTGTDIRQKWGGYRVFFHQKPRNQTPPDKFAEFRMWLGGWGVKNQQISAVLAKNTRYFFFVDDDPVTGRIEGKSVGMSGLLILPSYELESPYILLWSRGTRPSRHGLYSL